MSIDIYSDAIANVLANCQDFMKKRKVYNHINFSDIILKSKYVNCFN